MLQLCEVDTSDFKFAWYWNLLASKSLPGYVLPEIRNRISWTIQSYHTHEHDNIIQMNAMTDFSFCIQQDDCSWQVHACVSNMMTDNDNPMTLWTTQ